MSKYIELSKGKRAIVDDCFFEELNYFNWFVQTNPARTHWYAMRHMFGNHNKMIAMHREVLLLATIQPKRHTDHIDGDGLNNQLSNLRPATPLQNYHNQRKPRNNTSGYKGVSWHRERRMWVANIRINGRLKYLGLFHDPKEAHAAYVRAATEHFKEFANPG